VVHRSGEGQLAEVWSEQFYAALSLQPGSRAATNMILAMCRLMEITDAQNSEADFSDWTDAELEAEVRRVHQKFGVLTADSFEC